MDVSTYYTKQEILQAVRCGRLSIHAATLQLQQLKRAAVNKANALKGAA